VGRNEKKIENKITKIEDEHWMNQKKNLSEMGKKSRGTKSQINLGNQLE
jgi:hypothetical protein